MLKCVTSIAQDTKDDEEDINKYSIEDDYRYTPNIEKTSNKLHDISKIYLLHLAVYLVKENIKIDIN